MSQVINRELGITCQEKTSHAQLGNTGSCLCGFKTYAVKKELDVNNLPTCGWCSQPPSISDIQTQEVFCATEGCPAFSNVVTKERWCERGVHEMEVMWIPAEEPIFVLRGTDKLAQYPVYSWIELAERVKVPEHKLDSALKIAGAMAALDLAGKTKLPD